jgi:hypothetical protein
MTNTNTIRFDDFDVLNSETGQQEGVLQAVYRGNYPSAYTHDKNVPLKLFGNTGNSQCGVLLSAVAAGMAYPMGNAVPTFCGLRPRPQFTSVDWNGVVEVKTVSQVKDFFGVDGPAKIGDDMIVQQSHVFGNKNNGTQVKGWKLEEVGYSNSKKKRKAKYVTSIKEVQDMIQVAYEGQIGEFGTTFELHFKLPDQEHGIVQKGNNFFGQVEALDSKFNPPMGGFARQLEAMDLACTCIRLYKCPCNFAKDKRILCRCPLYAQVAEHAAEGKSQSAPKVVMVGAASTPFKITAPPQAVMQDLPDMPDLGK